VLIEVFLSLGVTAEALQANICFQVEGVPHQPFFF